MERLSKQEVGVTPARYYLGMRLERAHLLLLTLAMSIIDVAFACGFVSASHFGKVYRETYARTPPNTDSNGGTIQASERLRIAGGWHDTGHPRATSQFCFCAYKCC
ncbi:MAG: helix-turn-helix domain-containing protein [Mesorhizobium sp.]|nr:MAG: helix-turn-helix domain-containing protein [Mesorhizobium sp.]